MIEQLSGIADEINLKRNDVLEELASKKDCLPVPRHLTDNVEIFEAFNNLEGVDLWGNAFYQAGYIKACTDMLALVENVIDGVLSESDGNNPLQDAENNERRMDGEPRGGGREN